MQINKVRQSKSQTFVWAHPGLNVQPCGTVLAPMAVSAAGEARGELHHLIQGTETDDVWGLSFLGYKKLQPKEKELRKEISF